jgi:hypothetical protein
MQWIARRLSRLGWIAVPIAAYVAITLGLPLANGAAMRGGFAHHAAWVLGGCLLVVVGALIGGIAIDAIRGSIERLRHYLGGPP